MGILDDDGKTLSTDTSAAVSTIGPRHGCFKYIVTLRSSDRHQGPQQEPVQAVSGVYPDPDLCGTPGAADRALAGRQQLAGLAHQTL